MIPYFLDERTNADLSKTRDYDPRALAPPRHFRARPEPSRDAETRLGRSRDRANMSCASFASPLGASRVAPSRRSRRPRGSSSRTVPTAAVPDVRPSSGAELLRRLDIDAPGWSGGYGTGGKVWSSSAVLCDWLVDNAAGLNLRGASVAELGSGTGVVGIACAALGASRVVLSDGGSKSLLRLAKDNAAKNARAGNIDLDATDARAGLRGLGANGLHDVVADLVLQRARRRGQLDDEADVVALDADILDHAQGHKVLAEIGVLDGPEGVVNLLACERHGVRAPM